MKKLAFISALFFIYPLLAKGSLIPNSTLSYNFCNTQSITLNINNTLKTYKYAKKNLFCFSNLYNKIDFSKQYAKGIYTIKNKRVIKVPLPIGFKQYGVASYYHSKFAGLKTSNGEKLNLNALTAAHKTLPFNTLVKVTNLKTGKSIVVRINDRGPFVPGRILDLTQKAAKKLGIYNKGVARIKLEVIG